MTSSTRANMFWDGNFSNTWIIVTDSNNCDIQVTLEDLMKEKPIDKNIYIIVDYCGQSWWISQDLHFPM
jgi:hypothetical protein